MRCVHEASLYGHQNSFLTLTYSDDHVPASFSVNTRDLQLFHKRLRKSLPQKIRHFACGEYGDDNLRPHYHSLIFNHDFPDKTLWAIREGNRFYKSKALEQLWPFGLSEIGDLTFESAAYVSRYVMKKITGDKADEHYYRRSPVDGELYRVEPEFLVMSRRPGIGRGWLDKYKSDVFPSDFIVVDGRKLKPPRFYIDNLTDDEKEVIKRNRKGLKTTAHGWRELHKKRRYNNSRDRLAVREEVHQARASRLKRSL